jgi:hypothetical protein
VSEWDDGFAGYCGQEWETDNDHRHECRRSPGHSVIESWHVESGTSRTDHWCYCGSKTYPQTPEPPRMNGETTVASGNASGLTLEDVRRAGREEAARLSVLSDPFRNRWNGSNSGTD